MDPKNIVVSCSPETFWLFKLIWGALLPLFLAYVASAAYVLQRRRQDIEVVHKAVKDMQVITMLALDRLAEKQVNPFLIREHAMELISRVRLELLHRPKRVQRIIRDVLEEFLRNAEIAHGRESGTLKEVLDRQNSTETQLIGLIKQLTVIEALWQAWSNPGINVSFEPLIERFSQSIEK